MRTLSRDEYVAMTEAWRSFDYRWKAWRALAAERGIVFPPAGSKHDSIEDEEPSQRAIIWQAIVDTPNLLREAIGRSRSWREVVGRILLGRERMRGDASLAERDAAWYKREVPTHTEAVQSLASILGRIADSRP